jgi:hypothetical protein
MLHARFLIMGLVIGTSVSNVLRKVIFERKTIFAMSQSLEFLTQHMEVLVSSHFCGLRYCSAVYPHWVQRSEMLPNGL